MEQEFNFLPFREAVRKHIDSLLEDHKVAYRVSVGRDELWEAYLNAFPPEERQVHNCNCCKSFIRRMGNGGVIKEGRFVSFLEVKDSVAPEWVPVVEAMLSIIRTHPIATVFSTSERREGTESNVAEKDYGVTTFNHLYADIPRVHRRSVSQVAMLNTARLTLRRALTELTADSVSEVLALIEDNNLYRGDTHKATLLAFQDLQTELLEADDAEIFIWGALETARPAVAGIRNSSIGALLVNLSEGMDLPEAVGRYEAMVAPQNYQRAKEVVTPRQIEAAREELKDYKYSLPRRFATLRELPVKEALFVDRQQTVGADLFDEMAAEVTVNPNTFRNASPVTLEQLLSEGIESLEVFVERSLFPNFVSLITEQNEGAPCLFAHGNPFSWAYTGGVADSMKERVKRAGGKVDGVLRISLGWENTDDLDLHVTEPDGNRIYYSSKYSYTTGGQLDVDMNVSELVRGAVENVTYPDDRKLNGRFVVKVNNFTKRETIDQGYRIEVEYKGELFTFEAANNPRGSETETVCEFTVKDGAITMHTKGAGSSVTSVAKWGVNSNRFYPVELLLESPNRWGGAEVGTKHYLFLSPAFVNEEQPRAFFNEQLDRSLVQNHKRALEVLGSKVKVPFSPQQASGLGFSATKRASVIVRYRVKGKQFINRLNF